MRHATTHGTLKIALCFELIDRFIASRLRLLIFVVTIDESEFATDRSTGSTGTDDRRVIMRDTEE